MAENVKRLYRSRKERMLAGICGGLGQYMGVDPTLVRLIFVLSVFLTFTTSLFLYFVLWLVIPEEPAVDVIDAPVSKEE